MAKFNKAKIVGKSIPNPFGILLPNKLDDNDLQFLSVLLNARMLSNEEKQEIFMAHVRMAISIVSRYAWTAPYLINDLIQAGMLAIAESIESAPETTSISAYIATKIHGAIIREITQNNVMSRQTYQRMMQKNPEFIPPKIIYCESMDRATITTLSGKEDDGNNPIKLKWNLSERVDNADPLKLIEVMEVVEKCIMLDENLKRREYKKVVLRLKASGYTNREISEIIEVSESYISVLVEDVRKKFEKIYY